MRWRSVHRMVLEITCRDQSSELSSSIMIPQKTVVADLTRSEDGLTLMTEYAPILFWGDIFAFPIEIWAFGRHINGGMTISGNNWKFWNTHK